MFRVSFDLPFQNVLNNLEANSDQLVKTQTEMSAGKRILLPSDDPAGTGRALELQAANSDNDQYLRTLASAQSWLDATDGALQDEVSTLQRVRELAVQAANGALSQADQTSIDSEVHQLLLHAVSTANSQLGQQYLFGGFDTTNAPFTYNSGTNTVSYNGTVPSAGPPPVTGLFTQEISPGVTISPNIVGTQGFPQLFTAIADLDNDLQTKTGDALAQSISGQRLTELDTAISQFTEMLAETGARSNEVQATTNRLNSNKLTITGILSSTTDLDMASAIVKFQSEQTVYQAALQTGAKVIQTSLLDFLH